MAKHTLRALIAGAALVPTMTLAACGSEAESGSSSTDTKTDQGANAEAITATGSATVKPITELIAQRGDFNVEVSADGTTDGFEAFCNGESDINDASVTIPGQGEPTDYQKMCADNGVEYVEVPIALDAVTIVKNNANDWAQNLTMDQLRQIWTEGGATKWSDLDPAWPDEEITLYGRPEGSGTLGYFQTAVLNDAPMRTDYKSTDDINELSGWVAEDVNGIAFMGIGNYLSTEGEIRDNIDNVSLDGIAPSREEAQSGNYPLTRKLYFYVSKASLDNKEQVRNFSEYYVDNVKGILPRVFFYALPDADYEAGRAALGDK